MSALQQGASPLAVDHLSVSFGDVSALSDVSLSVEPGEILGIAGESGCGKSTLGLAVLGLLPPSARVTGSVRLGDRELLGLSERALRDLRGREIGLIVQDPMTALDPCFSVGSQVRDAIAAHAELPRRELGARAIALLDEVGIPDAAARARDVPSKFSGGMRQRAVIAMALANDPGVLIADEPTTALDVTTQAQVLALLEQLRRRRGASIVLISHDLGVLAQVCDRVAILYAGQLVELGSAADVLRAPRHPYTRALVEAVPSPDHAPGALVTVGGRLPDLTDPPAGCRFVERCPYAMPICGTVPALEPVSDGHRVACWYAHGARE
jgi:oligopeptide/dipeptide ABC transporter ATP-binding protein